MSVTLINSADNISVIFEAQFSSETSKEKIASSHATISGRDSFYNYSIFNTFTIDVKYITSSDRLQINEWWENQSELFFTNYDQSTATVKITNDSQPSKEVSWPYWNLSTTQIKLGEI